MIKSIEDGLPVSNFKKLQDNLDLPDKDLARYIRIPKSTLALAVFEDAGLAKKWLKEDAYGLGDVSPLEYAVTEIGAREVEDLLGRIEHGVFSSHRRSVD